MQFPSPIPPSRLLPLLGCAGDPPTLKIGADLARYGIDPNQILLRHDSVIEDPTGLGYHRTSNWIIASARWHGLDTNQSGKVIERIINEWEEEGWVVSWACLDAIGVGAGTADYLWNRGDRWKEIIRPINVGKRNNTNEDRFRNARSELAWVVRGAFRARLMHLMTPSHTIIKEAIKRGSLTESDCIPNEPTIRNLQEQATTLAYKADERSGGVIYVESKDDYRDRTEGKSTNEFDALCLAMNDRMMGLEKRPSIQERAIADFLGR